MRSIKKESIDHNVTVMKVASNIGSDIDSNSDSELEPVLLYRSACPRQAFVSTIKSAPELRIESDTESNAE